MLNDSEEGTLGSANDRVGPGRYSKLAKSVNKAQQYPQFSGEPLNSLLRGRLLSLGRLLSHTKSTFNVHVMLFSWCRGPSHEGELRWAEGKGNGLSLRSGSKKAGS